MLDAFNAKSQEEADQIAESKWKAFNDSEFLMVKTTSEFMPNRYYGTGGTIIETPPHLVVDL